MADFLDFLFFAVLGAAFFFSILGCILLLYIRLVTAQLLEKHVAGSRADKYNVGYPAMDKQAAVTQVHCVSPRSDTNTEVYTLQPPQQIYTEPEKPGPDPAQHENLVRVHSGHIKLERVNFDVAKSDAASQTEPNSDVSSPTRVKYQDDEDDRML
jgi:hypothetical protein